MCQLGTGRSRRSDRRTAVCLAHSADERSPHHAERRRHPERWHHRRGPLRQPERLLRQLPHNGVRGRRDSRPAPVATTLSRGGGGDGSPLGYARAARSAGDGLDLPEEGASSGSAKRTCGRVGLWRPQGSLSPPWGTIGWLARLPHLAAQDSAERRIYLTRGKTETRCGAARAAWRRKPAPSGSARPEGYGATRREPPWGED